MAIFIILASLILLTDRNWIESIHEIFGSELKVQKLEHFVGQIRVDYELGRIKERPDIPPFKFYSDLLAESLQLSYAFGANISRFLKELAPILAKERFFERLWCKHLNQSILQMLLSALLTWAMILSSASAFDTRPSLTLIACLSIIQCAGVIISLITFIFLKKLIQKNVGFYLKGLLIFYGMTQAGAPLNKAVEKAGIQSIFNDQDPEFNHLRETLQFYIESAFSGGINLEEGPLGLIQEVWSLYQQRLNAFQAKMAFAQFLILAVFFVIPYFGSLLFLIGETLSNLT